MKELRNLLFLLALAFLFMDSTCAPIASTPTETTKNEKVTKQPTIASNNCIDASKIKTNNCPDNYAPVCGCNGKTYPNECNAKSAGVITYIKGECNLDCRDPKLIKKEGKCITQYNPVCGCDGETYSNSCVAKLSGVKTWTSGPCSDGCVDASKKTTNNCPDNWEPVCGCNSQTYGNECSAKAAGVLRWEKGECQTKTTNEKPDKCIDPSRQSMRSCPDNYDPVCGCDNVTYSNQCNAEIKGVLRWIKGKCGKVDPNCFDQSKIDPNGQCTMNYAPVCGCNGQTYSNSCVAKKSGVLKWESGPCKGK